MKMNLTREKIFELFFVLNQDFSNETMYDKRFTYAIGRNLESLKPEVAALLKARETSVQEFKEFEVKKEDILKKYAKKDDQGSPISVEAEMNGRRYVFENSDAENSAKVEITALTEQYKDAIQKRQSEINLYNEIVSEEIEVDITTTSFKYFPEKMSMTQMKILRSLIKEDDDQLEKLMTE